MRSSGKFHLMQGKGYLNGAPKQLEILNFPNTATSIRTRSILKTTIWIF